MCKSCGFLIEFRLKVTTGAPESAVSDWPLIRTNARQTPEMDPDAILATQL